MKKFLSLSKVKCLFLLASLLLSACNTRDDVKAQYVPVRHGQIEYYQLGQGSPIVMITGYATDVSAWSNSFVNALAKEHQLIILNNRQVAGSTIKSNRYDTKALAGDTYQLIEKLGLKKPSVLGISMGGMIAQQLAVQHPEAIGSLILINTAIAGKQAVHPSPDVEEKMFNMPTSKMGRYSLAVQYFFPLSWQPKMAYALANDRFEPEGYEEIDVEDVLDEQRYLIKDWTHDNHAATELKKLTMPVLILNGEADIILPPVNSEILARNLPQARLVRWPEGGHAMIYQFPEEMAARINLFLRPNS